LRKEKKKQQEQYAKEERWRIATGDVS